MVVFDRFLARLVQHDPKAWIIKGGLALQLRLGDRARTTRDIDASLDRPWQRHELSAHVRRASSVSLGDWFEFEVSEPLPVATGAPAGGFRFPIRCLLDGRNFEAFHLDVGLGDALNGKPDEVVGPDLLGFAEILPARIPCCPLTTQIAEKLHALSRPYAAGGSTRVRDIVDILLIAKLGPLHSRQLQQAILATFAARGTHSCPKRFPDPAANLTAPYRKLFRELHLAWPTLQEAIQAAELFLNPILSGTVSFRWDSAQWKWK